MSGIYLVVSRIDDGSRSEQAVAEVWPEIRGQINAIVDELELQPPKPRRRRRPRSDQGLTPKQIEAQGLLGHHNGNRSKAAREMGVTPQTFRQHIDAGNKKLG